MAVALIVFLLVLLNALFVAAEFALIGVPRPAVEKRAAEGSKLARSVLEVLRDPRRQDRYIATAQIGITAASLGLGMYGEQKLAAYLEEIFGRWGIESWIPAHAAASVVAVGALTYLHIVLGEMIPKAIALQYAEATALWISTPMRWVNRALRPLVLALDGIGNLLLRLFGVRRELSTRVPTSETLRFVIRESVQKGKLSAGAGSVLEELFAFSELTAAEVMTPRVRIVAIEENATPAELWRVIRAAHHSRYPVYRESLDRIVGYVRVRDVLAHLLEGKGLSSEAIRPIPFVAATARLDAVHRRMRQEHTQIAVVMDEFGGTAGLITTDDLYEEVIGEIPESPAAALPVYEVEGELRALGSARIDEVGDQLGLELEHEDVDTVSGLVLSILNRPAQVGDRVEWGGIEFEVLAVEGRGVRECALRLRPGLREDLGEDQENSEPA
ncbi:MAG: hemolysin family protein [Pseudomonadota bacterium]|nr:MAG: HlyC/CorC family transporter [Pseudomonadota bacterium]